MEVEQIDFDLVIMKWQVFILYNKQFRRVRFSFRMLKKHRSQRNCSSNQFNNTRSFSNLPHHQKLPFNLRDLSLRKSYFCPPAGLDQSYASRSHIAGADIPLVEIVHSSQRWLLLQSPNFSRNFFKKLNQGQFGNPYEQLMRIFKGFVALTRIFGYFRPTNEMITLQKKDIRVWINEDIFSNQPQMSLRNGKEGQKQFVVAFLAMVQSQMNDWQRAINVCGVDEAVKLLQWRSRLNRGSYTAVNASKQGIQFASQSDNSINNSELISYHNFLKGCKSAQESDRKCPTDYLQGDLSRSITLQEEQKRKVPKKINKLLSDSKQQMKSSIYEEIKIVEHAHDVRKTKKKFNLTSTSSTLQKFSEKLGTTIGRKKFKIQKTDKEAKQKQQLAQPIEPKDKQRKKGGMHKSQPINIANELQGLFEQDQIPQLKLGIEGNCEELQRIAQEIEQVLIW